MPTKLLKSGRQPAKRSANAIELIRPTSPPWQLPWLVSGFSTRKRGLSTVFGRRDLNLGLARVDSPKIVERNRQLFFREVLGGGKQPFTLVSLKQIHSGIIHVIDRPPKRAPKQLLAGDGLLTQAPGLLLSIQTADCVPILLFDPVKRVVGAFHAGWRGTAKRIIEKAVGEMQAHFESRPQDIQAAIGPAIGSCCYAVGEEVIDEFHSQFSYAASLFSEVFDDDPIKKKYPMLFLSARPPGHSNLGPQIHLDLIAANRRQLLDAGVRATNIWSADLCTGCNTDRLFSHRKEGGFTGRMMAVIGIRA